MRIMKWGVAALGILAVTAIIGFGLLSSGGIAQAADPPGGNGTRAKYEDVLAQKLGITTAQLQTAQKAAIDQLVDNAVTAGTLTPTEAAKIKSMDANGPRGHVLRHLGGRIRGAATHIVDSAAKTIGISKDDVKTGLQNGQSLATIAAAHNVSRDQLKAGITADVKAQLDAAVKGNKITQAQEDKVVSGLSSRLDKIVDRTGGHGGKKSVTTVSPTPTTAQ